MSLLAVLLAGVGVLLAGYALGYWIGREDGYEAAEGLREVFLVMAQELSMAEWEGVVIREGQAAPYDWEDE